MSLSSAFAENRNWGMLGHWILIDLGFIDGGSLWKNIKRLASPDNCHYTLFMISMSVRVDFLLLWFVAQVLQMYLPFCGISISNAKLFSESRKEYERSRVRERTCAFTRKQELRREQHFYNALLWSRRLCWRWSTTCLKNKPTWRRLLGRSCSER